MKLNSYKIITAAMGLLFGIFINMHYRAIKTVQEEPISEDKPIQLESENTMLNLLTLQENMKASEDAVAIKLQEIDKLNSKIESMQIMAGVTPVQGRGVIVTLKDSTINFGDQIDPNALIIHDEDILLVINELNSAGSEAISINGHRYVSTSSIRCVGALVMINGAKIAPPFEIAAIGNPDILEAALRLQGGVIDSLLIWGIEVTIEAVPEIIIPSYNGRYEFTEASVIIEE